MTHRPHLTPRAAISGIELGVHGGTDSAESSTLGLSESEIIDFSASVSPFGPSPQVAEAIKNIDLSAYPDPGAPGLTSEIASMASNEGAASIGPDQIIPTAGSVELLSLVASTYLEPGRTLLTLDPHFGEYHPVAQTMGAAVETYPVRRDAETGLFSLDTRGFVDWVAAHLPAVVILNDPHNPTGLTFGGSLVERILDLEGELLLVVDEAYREFMSFPPDLTSHLDSGRLVLMRSLTKAHALAGIRLGYGISSPEVISRLRTVQRPWTVSSVAQAAGRATLSDTEWLVRNLRALSDEKEFLVQGLTVQGLKILPSSANFFLLDLADTKGGARSLRDYLLEQRIRVRSCESFGLPEHIRISPRRHGDNERLLHQVGCWVGGQSV